MYRSCPLVQNFAKQGLKIRIRKESGPRPSRYIHTKRKDIRKAIQAPPSETSEEDEEQDQLIQPQPTTTTTTTTTTTVSAFKRVNPPTPGKYYYQNSFDWVVSNHVIFRSYNYINKT
jgi:hypothetical protein